MLYIHDMLGFYIWTFDQLLGFMTDFTSFPNQIWSTASTYIQKLSDLKHLSNVSQERIHN